MAPAHFDDLKSCGMLLFFHEDVIAEGFSKQFLIKFYIHIVYITCTDMAEYY